MGCSGSIKRIEKLEKDIENLKEMQNDKLNHIIKLLETKKKAQTRISSSSDSPVKGKLKDYEKRIR